MYRFWLYSALAVFCPAQVTADTPVSPLETAPPMIAQEAEIVTYPARFFEQYQPLTALDMVRQVPGFQVDDGDELRGFGGTAGNVLIDGSRPSAKQDLVSAILARIPAGNVDRIELIRARVQDVNMQGHSLIANVIMDKGVETSNRWEAYMTYTSPSPLGLGASVSKYGRRGAVDYNMGIDIERDTNGITGTVEKYDAAGDLIELRADEREQSGLGISGIHFNASTSIGVTRYNLYTKFGFREGDGLEVSQRFPRVPGEFPHDILFVDDERAPQYELGVDGERILAHGLEGKGILLVTHGAQRAVVTQETLDAAGSRTNLKVAREESDTTEAIARLELGWSGWDGHAVTADFEAAYNLLDNALVLTEDSGAGFSTIPVPNANSRVREVRGDVLLKDTWSPGVWLLDYGLGAEVSRITQTGDAEQERTFLYFKPSILLTHTPNQTRQTRLRLEKEVSQLDFYDFVSTTVFVDDDLALGNPDLKPETTWIAELSHERRFGALGVLTLTGFHHWISDVLDLLPVSDRYEVPGNVGDGSRWGVEASGTLPLDWLRLPGGRLDLQVRWQDSEVNDPVTGESRSLSADGGFSGPPTIRFRSDNEYVVDLAFRQDREESAWAWGWDMAFQADRYLFKVNELERFEEGLELNAFIETTRWMDMKIRLEGRNLLNYLEVRDRLRYTGRRDLSPVTYRELRLRKPSRIFTVTFSGSF